MHAAASAATAARDRALGILIDRLGLPNPDDPMPPGPWDPVIRGIALAALAGLARGGGQPEPWLPFHLAAGPHPDPWLTAHPGAGPYPDDFDLYGTLASPWRNVVTEVIRRRHPEANDAIGGWGGGWQRVAPNPQPVPPRWAFVLAAASQTVLRAEMMGDLGRAMGADDAGARWIVTLTDDICPTPRPWPWPWPWPRPNWLEDMIDAADLTVVASVFSAASRRVADRELAQALDAQAGRLAEESVSQLG